MKKFVLIASLVLVPLVLAAPSVQAQTSPTNATANSQLANSNTANALGITTGVTTGITTGTPTTGQQQTSTSNRNPTAAAPSGRQRLDSVRPSRLAAIWQM